MAPSAVARRVLCLASKRGVLTREEVVTAGIHTYALSRFVRAGALERVGRGRYRRAEAPVTERHRLALAAAAVRKGVVCLLSAPGFHRLGTQPSHEVWIALDRSARPPAIQHPRLRVVRFSGKALHEGVETHRIEGETVRIYSLAETITDLFKYRNRIRLDVATEALREALRARQTTVDEILRTAEVCRARTVIRPYLEAMLA